MVTLGMTKAQQRDTADKATTTWPHSFRWWLSPGLVQQYLHFN